MLFNDNLSTKKSFDLELPIITKSIYSYVANDFIKIMQENNIKLNTLILGYLNNHYYHLIYDNLPSNKIILINLLKKESVDFYQLDYFKKQLSSQDYQQEINEINFTMTNLNNQ